MINKQFVLNTIPGNSTGKLSSICHSQPDECTVDIPFSKLYKVSKGAKIRNPYNQVPHLTQDTNGKVTNSQLDTTNESQEVSPFPAGDHKAHINRCVQRHSKHKTEQKHKWSTKEVPPWNSPYNILLEGLNQFNCANLVLNFNVDQDT